MKSKVVNNLAHKLIHNSETGIIIIDQQLQIVTWNNTMEAITGFSASDSEQKNALETLSFLSTHIKKGHLLKVFEGNDIMLSDILYKHKDCNKSGYLNASFTTFEEVGELFILIQLTDITRRKEAEAKIYKSEERFQKIAKVTNDVLWDWDISNNTIWWGDGISNIFGYAEADVDDNFMWWYNNIHPEDKERVLSSLEISVAEKNQYWSAEYKFQKKDGNYTDVKDMGFLVNNDTGQPVKMIGGLRDISDRVEHERQIKESELKYKNLINNAPVAVVVHYDGKVIMANAEAALTLRANNANDIIGKDIYEFLENKKDLNRIEKIKKGRKITKVQEKITRLDGKKVDVEIIAIPIKFDGNDAIQVVFTDITERIEAQKALEKSEAFYKNILANSFDGISIINEAGKNIFEGISNVRLHGYSKDEMENHNSFEFIHPEDKEKAKNDILSIKKEAGASVKNISRFRHKDGSWRIVRSILVNLLDDPSIQGIMVNYQDITKQRLAEDALKESEERLELAIQGADLGLWDKNIKNNTLSVNSNWAQMLGYDLEEALLKHSIEELVHPADKERIVNLMNDHLEGKTAYFEAEYRMLTKSGNYKWILDRGKVQERDELGNPIRALGTHLDINERKEAEEALKRSEELFRQLFQNTPIGIVLLDENRNILKSNNGFEKLFKYEANDLANGNIFNVFKLEAGNYETTYIDEKLEKRESIILETERLNKEGQRIPVLVNIVPVIVDNKLIRIFGIYVDMTDVKAKEEELRQLTVKLMRSNTELEQFAYITSHNLRSPVANLKGLLDLYKSFDIESRELVIEKIEISISQLDNTLKDLIEVVSLKNSIKEQSVAINFEQLLKTVEVDLEAQLLETDANIETDFSEAAGITYPLSHLQSIFQNMITNSIKYRSKGRELKIEIYSKLSEGFVELHFKDNGIGINLQRNKDKIFKMYQRLHDVAEGKGLGLYIIKSQVELLGGSINVISEEDKGAEFTVRLKDKPE